MCKVFNDFELQVRDHGVFCCRVRTRSGALVVILFPSVVHIIDTFYSFILGAVTQSSEFTNYVYSVMQFPVQSWTPNLAPIIGAGSLRSCSELYPHPHYAWR